MKEVWRQVFRAQEHLMATTVAAYHASNMTLSPVSPSIFDRIGEYAMTQNLDRTFNGSTHRFLVSIAHARINFPKQSVRFPVMCSEMKMAEMLIQTKFARAPSGNTFPNIQHA